MPANSTTLVSMLTPAGRGAVAVVAVEGPDGLAMVERSFRSQTQTQRFASRPFNTIVYGRWGNEPSEDVIVCRRAAESIEVHCHGGHAAVRRIIDDLLSAGAIEQPWHNWANRMESGQIRSAARIALAEASTANSAAILLDQYNGALEQAIAEIRDSIAAIQHGSSDANALDVPLTQIEMLLARGSLGIHLTQPWRVVIAGPPNVGKSSLVNALLGYQRTIVFDQPGTTRDAVTAQAALDGWPIVVTDTAGWRTSDDALEIAGIEIAKQRANSADCLILAFDASQPWTAENDQLIDQWHPAIVVQNKCDLPAANAAHGKALHCQAAGNPNVVCTSARTGFGIDALANAIVQSLVPIALQPGAAVPFTVQQAAQLSAAKHALQLGNLSAATEQLTAMLA